MNFRDYQRAAKKTADYPDVGNNFIYPTLGLTGEAGEVAEKIKRVLRENKGTISNTVKEEIAYELGDVLWYIAALCSELDIDMESVAEDNLNKLTSRLIRGTLHGNGDHR